MFPVQLSTLAEQTLKDLASDGEFSPKLNSHIGNGNTRLVDHTMIIRVNITGGASTYPLLEESTDFVKGEINLQNRKLGSNECLLGYKMALAYGRGAAAAKPRIIDYSFAFPAVLRNATIIAKQNSREVIKLPIADFIAKGTAQNPMELFTDFSIFKYFVDEETIEWEIEFPEGQSLPASATGDPDHYFEIRFSSLKTKLRR